MTARPVGWIGFVSVTGLLVISGWLVSRIADHVWGVAERRVARRIVAQHRGGA